jgi:hypothetical protein
MRLCTTIIGVVGDVIRARLAILAALRGELPRLEATRVDPFVASGPHRRFCD